jgi:hypothetical protein
VDAAQIAGAIVEQCDHQTIRNEKCKM